MNRTYEQQNMTSNPPPDGPALRDLEENMDNVLSNEEENEREDMLYRVREDALAAGDDAVADAKAEGITDPDELAEIFKKASSQSYADAMDGEVAVFCQSCREIIGSQELQAEGGATDEE